jgi:hypothetical protein
VHILRRYHREEKEEKMAKLPRENPKTKGRKRSPERLTE